MELGIGFLIGLLGGGVLAVIVAVLITASRRAVKTVAPAPPAAPAGERRKNTAVEPPAGREQEERGASGNTVIVAEMEARDDKLSRSIQEVRDLLFHLVDVISHTESASGKAAMAFNSAKDAIDGLDLHHSDELAEAQRTLVIEIDRVLQSNLELHAELDKANRGIADQRHQIEDLRVQARIDALTRIPNRAAFDERLKEYVGLLERTGLIFTLMLLDIDHFKRVNDTHGHVNGDRILRGLAAKITASVRTNDFAARYGGEEFAVIFPGTALDDATLVAERMRQDISKTNFRLDHSNIKMTVSGGLAECTKGMTTEKILAAADHALYRAKDRGRNRVAADGRGEANKQLTINNNGKFSH